ncbi:diacylglycerol/lipid kinase family protein [Natrononativus amylolyticus]|uniref:diacylglycerol/lipid kinase family protein n=1 Tax=Natrononativus amylolyticus TaxID=2963434 RepID=UPI0020CE439E|nr:diacylglycerol kinase family protein [Natrononativus amylolyticus]
MDETGTGRVLICNPTSGSEDHVERVLALAREHELEARVTAEEGDATRLAREAVDAGATLVVAAGGDGTINEVVNGLKQGGLERIALAVVPAGTGNNFASNLGVEGLEDAFEAIERDERRTIDLGIADDRAFVNSCVGGVTAEASGATTSEEKRALGVLAYVRETLETAAGFDPLPLRVTLGNDDEGRETWAGEAMFVLVGNARRFTNARRAQANVEDGLFEVTIVERAPTVDLVGEAALERLFGREADHIVRRRVPSLSVESLGERPVEYSLDGEMLEATALSLETEPSTLTVIVGKSYEPDPDAASDAEPW